MAEIWSTIYSTSISFTTKEMIIVYNFIQKVCFYQYSQNINNTKYIEK